MEKQPPPHKLPAQGPFTIVQKWRKLGIPKVGLNPDSAICMWPLVAQLVRNPPAAWETWVRSLGWEDPLEKGKATHSNILA